MVEHTSHATPKGNTWWSIVYALTSLRNYKVRNMGIALVLAIGVALPTTVFVWTATGTTLAVDNYFSENAYQLSVRFISTDPYNPAEADAMLAGARSHPLIESVDRVPSTIGILTGDGIPDWTSYSPGLTNYLLGIKDTRVLVVTNQLLSRWTSEFTVTGNFSLSKGQVLVSEDFIEYARDVHGINIDIGSLIHIDVLKNAGGRGIPPRSVLRPQTAGNLTVAGIYMINSLRTQMSEVFPSSTRNNWDPLGTPEAVLGISDSVMILEEEVGEEATEEIAERGFYRSQFLVRVSQTNLLAAGPLMIGDNLLSFKTQIEEQYESFRVYGFDQIEDLDTYVQTYVSSQALTVVVFPVLIMSLMLTVFTSETSISRRRGEIGTLRSKGASFNQVFSTFMWESLILSLLGLVIGIGLSLVMAPLIGSSVGLFMIDANLYVSLVSNLSFPPLALVIAVAIAMYLPGAYILHVARKIDVTEVGQPMPSVPSEGAEVASIWPYTAGLGGVLSILLAMPILLPPSGVYVVAEVLGATLLLFVASYLGSRTMRLVTAKLSGRTSFVLGEKSLYLSQSLKKRKGQFIPLLVILTLTLTTSTMMLIQSSSFEATLTNELSYSIGADMRVEVNDRPLTYNRTLLSYPGVLSVTPVIETWAQVGTNYFFIEGVEALEYLEIAKFSQNSFVSGTPESVMTTLNSTSNGIIISEFYSNLWNRTIGDVISVFYGTINTTRAGVFEIVGIMRSAPGFGAASRHGLAGTSFASQFGFQVGQGGFALMNLDFISENSRIETVDLFFVETVSFANMTPMIEDLDEEHNVEVFTPDTFDLATHSFAIQLFMSGIHGLTAIAFIMCTVMGLSAIALFLGSAVLEREPEYAIFRAIGGTKRQVVMMVFGEFAGTVVAALSISLILGLVFGYTMSVLTFGLSPFTPILQELLALPFTMMFAILALESIVMLASCYLPASRAGSVNPASALRNL